MAFQQEIVGHRFGPTPFRYDFRQTALYALACGAGADELELLYEGRGPKVLPTFAVVCVFEPLLAALKKLGGNMLTLVHGGQRCSFTRPIPPNAAVETYVTVTGLYDKGKGALAVLNTETLDASGPLFSTEWQIFFRGEGGFGGERGPEAPQLEPPARACDQRVVMPTAPTQALLYRLASGDLNPIHADPAIAERAKFERPIFHGLGTFGHAARAAIQTLCARDPSRLRSIEGRFSKPVYPGDTIQTDLWVVAPGEAVYTASVRGEPVLTLGRVQYEP